MKKKSITTILIIAITLIFTAVSFGKGHTTRWPQCTAFSQCAKHEMKVKQIVVNVTEDTKVENDAHVAVIDSEKDSITLQSKKDK